MDVLLQEDGQLATAASEAVNGGVRG
jgi:hypothetical protein